MSKLTDAETTGLYEAVRAEHAAQRAATEAVKTFGPVDVFVHLEQSAARHIAALCDTLHAAGANAPVLAPVEPAQHETLTDALAAAIARETKTAEIYDRILQHSNNAELERVLRPLWQSVSHLHLTALNDQLELSS